MKTIHISTAAPYDVHIGAGLLDSVGAIFASVCRPSTAAVVTDSNVAPLYLERCVKSLEKAGFSAVSYIFPAGELSKSFSTLVDILEFFASSGLTRSDLVVALGGGVTGDMAGFAAAVYQRGVRYAQIPTTLLAAVDSSVGGKTAVDLKAGKNLAGAFHQPIAVVCDTDTFKTLPPDVFADGCAETIKYGVLCDPALFDAFRGDAKSSIESIVARAVEIKGEYVSRDERESGERMFLNLGHTLAHAIEKLSGYTVPHGHAVAIGTVLIARAGEKTGVTKPGTADELIDIFKRNNLPTETAFTPDELFGAAKGDKKRSGSQITVVLIEEIGKCRLEKLELDELRKLIQLVISNE